MNLEAIYYCATNSNTWGKGYSPAEAKKNAKVMRGNEKRIQYYIMAAILNNPTPEELKNLHDCITANNFDGSPQYYRDDRTEEDTEMINRLHVGWLTIEKNF